MVLCEIIVEHDGASHRLDFDTDDGFEVFQFQVFSLTMIPPENQKILDSSNMPLGGDGSDVLVRLLSSSPPYTVRLVEEVEKDAEEVEKGVSPQMLAEIEKADEALARLLQAEEEANFLQEQSGEQGKRQFASKLEVYVSQVLQYEDPLRQQKARDTVRLTELEEKAVVALAKEGQTNPTREEIDHYILYQLLMWFKNSFRWITTAPCSHCEGETTHAGTGSPTHEELQYGGSRVELHRCKRCWKVTRFPRYNDTLKLLETRSGRCGEWANCFTLYCRAFGYQARLVLDFTDHVWTECFSDHLGRWIHLDPCEGAFDKPLLYEQGWQKKLSYLIGISKDGFYDVTKRYTRNWDEVRTRRTITTEHNVVDVISSLTECLRRSFSHDYLDKLRACDEKEAVELRESQNQNRAESGLLPGRLTGTEEWRRARGEMGSSTVSNGLEIKACVKRKCVDDHVSKVFRALGKLYSLSLKDPSLHILENLLNDLNKLKEVPYKARKSVSLPHIAATDNDIMHCFYNALSLRQNTEKDTNDTVSSVVDIATALTLPVFLENLKILVDLSKDYLKAGLVRNQLRFLSMHERLSGAWTQASGEEPPLGIAISAFDGLPSTKWEEPNGAKGGWITYYMPDKLDAKVAAYELMSANDCPERDPMNWILEGSVDGGCTWTEVDARSSKMFKQRFESQYFEIHPERRLACNALRLRFLAVRDSTSQSRLQLSCINFYKTA